MAKDYLNELGEGMVDPTEIDWTDYRFSIPPKIYGELCICFEWDFPISEITSILKLQPHCAQRYADTRVNPFEGKHNPGYWEYRSEIVSDFGCELVVQELQSIFTTHWEELQIVKAQYHPSDIFIRIYAEIEGEADYPAIRIPNSLMKYIVELEADIDIVLSNNYCSAKH